MKKNLVLAAGLLLAGSLDCAFAASVSGRVSIAPRRGPTAKLSETLVWLEPSEKVRPRKAENVKVTTRTKTLAPHVMAVPVGSTVQFPNDDPILHNLFSVSSPNNFDLGLYRRNAGKSQKFETPGVVNIYCNVHPSMSAVMHVMATPYYVFADATGAFVLDDVPPGEYKLHSWNEIGGVDVRPVVVTANGRSVRGELAVLLDGRQQRAAQHLNKYGQPYSRSTNEY